jgi:tetratricopeptide (TPR) repeat protein
MVFLERFCIEGSKPKTRGRKPLRSESCRILDSDSQLPFGAIAKEQKAKTRGEDASGSTSAALAQPTEHPLLSTEVQSYVALCKAVYWESLREYREAKEQMVSAIQFAPHSSFLHAKLAEILINVEDFSGALSACERSLKLNPDNAETHYLLGFLKVNWERDQRGAIDEFKRAAELNPEHIGAQYRLASLLFREGDYSEAARAYSEMVKLRPYDPKLRYKLGYSYLKSGETAEAIK